MIPPACSNRKSNSRFSTVEAARQAVHAAGGRLVVSRRLLDDRLFDTPDRRCGDAGCALRVRRDGDARVSDVQGPGPAGPRSRAREEIETVVGDRRGRDRDRRHARLPCQVFRAREVSRGIRARRGARRDRRDADRRLRRDRGHAGRDRRRRPRALGKSRADYRLESYPRLYAAWCATRGRHAGRHDVRVGVDDRRLTHAPAAGARARGGPRHAARSAHAPRRQARRAARRTHAHRARARLARDASGVRDVVLNLHHRPETIAGDRRRRRASRHARALLVGAAASRIGRRPAPRAAAPRLPTTFLHRQRRHAVRRSISRR